MTCGKAYYEEFQVGFSTEISIGIGGTFEDFEVGVGVSAGADVSRTFSVTLPEQPCTQFKVVPILQRLSAIQAYHFLGDYNEPGPDGVSYGDYSGQDSFDLGYLPHVYQLECKAKCKDTCDCDKYWETHSWP